MGVAPPAPYRPPTLAPMAPFRPPWVGLPALYRPLTPRLRLLPAHHRALSMPPNKDHIMAPHRALIMAPHKAPTKGPPDQP